MSVTKLFAFFFKENLYFPSICFSTLIYFCPDYHRTILFCPVVQLFAKKFLKIFLKEFVTASRELTSGHVTGPGYEAAAGGQDGRSSLPVAKVHLLLHTELKYIYCEYCDQNSREVYIYVKGEGKSSLLLKFHLLLITEVYGSQLTDVTH